MASNFFGDMVKAVADFIEFDSMINIRPYDNNCSKDVVNKEVRNKIIDVVNKKL